MYGTSCSSPPLWNLEQSQNTVLENIPQWSLNRAMASQNIGNTQSFFWQEPPTMVSPPVTLNTSSFQNLSWTYTILRLGHFSSHTRCYCLGLETMEQGKIWCYDWWWSFWTDTLCELGLAISSCEDFISGNISSWNHTTIGPRPYSWLPFHNLHTASLGFWIQAQPQWNFGFREINISYCDAEFLMKWNLVVESYCHLRWEYKLVVARGRASSGRPTMAKILYCWRRLQSGT